MLLGMFLTLAAGCGNEPRRGSEGRTAKSFPEPSATPSASADIAHPVVAVALEEANTPDVVVEGETVHVVWVAYGNVVYGQYRKDGELSKEGVRVNHEFGVVASGAFRGPDVDIGKDGRIHVAWYPNLEDEKQRVQSGVYYAHADPGQTFTDARNLNRQPSDNYSIAANESGRVDVMFTAEDLFAQRSEDGGVTWSDPKIFRSEALPCECCATRLQYDDEGTLYALYRERTNDIRDIHVIVDAASGPLPARKLATEPWEVTICPMSGSYLAPTNDGMAAAWRTKDQIEFTRLGDDGQPVLDVTRVEGGPGKRYPVIVVADDGTMLVAYKTAVTLHWQRYDPGGKPIGEPGSRETENPDRPAGGVVPDGTFMLFG